MIRDEYLRRITDACYVDLYLSATDGARGYWPFRMQPVHEADKRHRNACERFIIDSSFQDETITNEDVLDCAHRLDAEIAVLADVWQDKDATVDAVLDGVELADDHDFSGQIMAPLQAPHDECYKELEGQLDIYAVGGVKDKEDPKKIEAARSVRDVAGYDVHLHGLGYGVTDTLVRAVRQDNGLLDSLDYSSPVQNAMNVPTEAGKERMSVVSSQAMATLVKDARRLTPFVEEQTPADLRSSGETGLEEWA